MKNLGGRPRKLKIDLTSESLKETLNKIWAETEDQRSKAILTYNKWIREVKDANDIGMMGKVVTDQLKVVNEIIEKRLSVARIIQNVVTKESKDEKNTESQSVISEEDKQYLKSLMQKPQKEESLKQILKKENEELKNIEEEGKSKPESGESV